MGILPFLFDSLKEDKSTSSPSLLPPPRSSQFLIFSSFFRTDLKKGKADLKTGNMKLFLRLLLFRTHTNTEIVLPRNKSKNSPRQQKIFSIAFSTTSLLL